MKVQCETRELLEAAHLVSGVVSAHSTRPILQSLHLEADVSNGVRIQGTDLEVGLAIRVDEVSVEEPGIAVVTANRLHAILREARDAETRLETDADDGSLQVSSGNSRFRVATGVADEFPTIDFKLGEGTLKAKREPFLKMLQRSAVAAAKDATRFQMHSVLIDASADGFKLVSTDGKRMAVCEGQGESGLGEGQYIVPLKGVDLLARILAVEVAEDIEIHLDQSEITYKSDRVSLSCRLVEGRYPEYSRALPGAGEYTYDLPTEELQIALRQASIMTTKETNSVQFSFNGDRLVVSAQANNVGDSRIELGVEPVEAKDEGLTISFNPGYLIDMIRVADVPKLRGYFRDRKTAGLFCIPGDEAAFRHVVMPLVANE